MSRELLTHIVSILTIGVLTHQISKKNNSVSLKLSLAATKPAGLGVHPSAAMFCQAPFTNCTFTT